MDTYEQNLHINDSAFDSMRADTDIVLQRLIKNMVEKDSQEGKVTITIDVTLQQDFIPNRDPKVEGETRRVLMPIISHKVGSVMQIKNEAKGSKNYDGMELVWDDEKGEYVLKPIANTDQMTIFDAEFREVYDSESEEDEEELALEGRKVVGLPAPEEEIVNEEDIEITESEDDMSDEFDDIEEIPFGGNDDDYDYEEPEEF